MVPPDVTVPGTQAGYSTDYPDDPDRTIQVTAADTTVTTVYVHDTPEADPALDTACAAPVPAARCHDS